MSAADPDRPWVLPLVVAGLVLVGLVALRAWQPAPTPDPPPSAVAAAPDGPQACAACHAAEVEAWRASNHAGAERALGSDEPLQDGFLTAIGPAGEEGAFEPVRAIGVEPLWQYLVPLGRPGALQVTQAAWDPARSEWFDVFGDGRGPGEWGHWTGGAMTWNSQCARCHNTGVRRGWDEETRSYDTRVDEVGVGCAACHGDLSAHAAGGPPPAAPPAELQQQTCAACHARRAELTAAWAPGEPFADHHAPTYVDATDLYWPDGQVRAEVFEYSAFRSSAMHDRGVRCTTCHDPHRAAPPAEADKLCRTCHEALPGFADHDPHPDPVAPGCVGCHMPITTYMQRDPRHDHGFRIPDPELTARHGIPNACDRCHDDPAFVRRAAARWWPDLGGSHRTRADLVARARGGDDAAVPGLIAQLADDPIGSWRATAAALLARWVDDDTVRSALRAALGDDDPWVRFAAAGSLAPLAPAPDVRPGLEALLADPVRAVRVEAARALRGAYRPDDPAMAGYVAYLTHNIDQPQALHERATWWLELGAPERARADLELAVQLDPRSAMGHEALGVTWSALGHPDRAQAALEAAVVLVPDDPELQYRLGLARVGTGDLTGAAEALRQATTLDERHPRAWYNLGVLLGEQEAWAEALEALAHAVEATPDDPEVHYAVASTHFRSGDRARARAAAEAVLRLAPGHPGATAILASP